ncbi:DNA cytosine methyltransferase [Nitrosomonas sp. Nm58]|uniref:DNA cytosine methyltransferase n=1 Tax=Nitrosomonas sp. Nm58 TaxID=200126 RepID=UPI00089CA5E9|nr:DNA cytosine methyltransferase [Nitrosomonas sp. Nm58]SDY38202.1 DNA (cytosine-5)-methyltransferase 1 [Nitrosomonas sp. Nm58]
MKAYYNEFDRDAAAWLRQLINGGLIADGEVDERSITEVEANDLVGFDRCHFFAGVGTWDYCLNEAGWGNRPVWTASLPCQPFSVAGKGFGKSDERHLLPHFVELVRQCKPDTLFGEQVASAIRHGWLDDLHAEMGKEGYAVGHCVFGAHSIGTAHIRQRLYWVANSIRTGSQGKVSGREDEKRQALERLTGCRGADSWMGITNSNRLKQRSEAAEAARYRNTVDATGGVDSRVEHSKSKQMGIPGQSRKRREADVVEWLYCRDNKYRPVKSGLKPLVDRTSTGVVYSGNQNQEINADYSLEAKTMRLRGYGNAIVAGCGIEFISAFMDVMHD